MGRYRRCSAAPGGGRFAGGRLREGHGRGAARTVDAAPRQVASATCASSVQPSSVRWYTRPCPDHRGPPRPSDSSPATCSDNTATTDSRGPSRFAGMAAPAPGDPRPTRTAPPRARPSRLAGLRSSARRSPHGALSPRQPPYTCINRRSDGSGTEDFNSRGRMPGRPAGGLAHPRRRARGVLARHVRW